MPKLLESTRSGRHQQLVDAAWRCIARQGYRDLTVDDICAEASLSKGAFYGYFPSKGALLLALIADDAETVTRTARSSETLQLPPLQRIRKLTEITLLHASDPARVQLRADVWGAIQTYPEVRAALTAAMDDRRHVLRDWIEEAVASGEIVIDFPANALASLLLAMSDGLYLHYALDPNAFRWRKVSKAVDAMLGGLAAPVSPTASTKTRAATN
jgi:AcrR family transcriptional regulator